MNITSFPSLALSSSTALHLPKPAPPLGCVIRLQRIHLALVGLTERIPSLLPHTLHLPHLPDRLLELLHARPVVLDVVFLDLLHEMVRLRSVHALEVLPGDVPQETQDGYNEKLQVEDGGGEELGNDTMVFG